MHFLLGSCLLTSPFFFLSRCAYPRESRGEERPSTSPPFANHGPRQPGPVSGPAFRGLWSFAAVSSIARTSSLYADADPLSSRIRDGAATPMQRAPKGTDHTWSSGPFKSRGIRNCARPTVPAVMTRLRCGERIIGDLFVRFAWRATRRMEVLDALSWGIARCNIYDLFMLVY